MIIIKTIHPIKLALGSYNIIGIPKFTKSADEFRSIGVIGPQMIIIINNVKHDVTHATDRHSLNN
jgi:hypothetical protein